MKNRRLHNYLVLALLFCVGLVSAVFGQQDLAKPVTVDDIKANINLAPCKNEERLDAVKSLFRAGGATEGDMNVQEFKNLQNLVVTKRGKTDGTVIVSAHYDKVKDGCGAIDNWTGIVIIANLYRTMRNIDTDKTFLFVAFDKEELGLFGSEAMAKSIPKEKRDFYCSNVNLDSFGFSYPQVMDNTSTQKMTDMVKELAAEVKMPFAHAAIPGADADSSSFKSRGIPSITLHGLNSDWQKYLHTPNDVVKNINPSSVLAGYQFTRRFLIKVDSSSCSIFRN
jgi:Peptidase family M28